jgi:cytochrome c oxidase subunit 2
MINLMVSIFSRLSFVFATLVIIGAGCQNAPKTSVSKPAAQPEKPVVVEQKEVVVEPPAAEVKVETKEQTVPAAVPKTSSETKATVKTTVPTVVKPAPTKPAPEPTPAPTPEPEPAKPEPVVAKPVVKEFTMTAKNWDFVPSTITVKKGDTVKLHIKSIDVDHGFNLSAFNVKAMLKPNETVTVDFVADKVGTHSFICSVFCGSGHQSMKGTLVVEE